MTACSLGHAEVPPVSAASGRSSLAAPCCTPRTPPTLHPTQVDYPGGSYWAVPAEARVGMLHALVHDALECAEMRSVGRGGAVWEEGWGRGWEKARGEGVPRALWCRTRWSARRWH